MFSQCTSLWKSFPIRPEKACSKAWIIIHLTNEKKKEAVLGLFTQLFNIDYCNNQQPVENKNTPRMHRNHVPLNCTDRTIAHIPHLALPSLPSPPAGPGDCSWFGCVTGRAGLLVCKRKRGQVESSTVILTFPLISSSVVPVLSGLSVFVGAVQCQITWPSKSRTAGRRGRPAGDGRNEWRRRTNCQSAHQACRGFCQDAIGHVVWVQVAYAGVEASVVLGSRRGSVLERVGEKARVELLQVSGSSSMRGA